MMVVASNLEPKEERIAKSFPSQDKGKEVNMLGLSSLAHIPNEPSRKG